MFAYFNDNYTWSSAFLLGLMAGGQLGELDRFLSPLRGQSPTSDAWDKAWTAMANQQEQLAQEDLRQGYGGSAGARLFRASMYHFCGERQLPLGERKSKSYEAAMNAFSRSIELLELPVQRVEIPFQDGNLAAYFVSAQTTQPAPVVIFYSGLDVVKEMLYGFIRDEFSKRGFHTLIVDTPGVGEALRLLNIASRFDYEVPTKAVVDYVEKRADVDPQRIGILGISLGGYYVTRSAAFEKRIKACAAWCGVWDYGAIWRKRHETQSQMISVPHFQLPWIMGTTSMEEALKRVQPFKLDGVMQKLDQPLLILHGEDDKAIPVEDATKAFEAAGSKDKTLKIFTAREGGAEHVQADEPDAARQLVADWFVQRFGI